MPAPPRDRLRLQDLEGRSLMSADIMVPGTDAHDVITLTRLDEYQVEVTVRSFLDPEWTRPTGAPVVHYSVNPAWAFLVRECGPGWLVTCDLAPVTDNIRVEGGPGTDRVEVIDLLGRSILVRGTYRTEEPVAGQPDRRADYWLGDWADGRWAYAEDGTDAHRPVDSATLTEGVDMVAGAAVGVRFQIDHPDLIPPPADPGDGDPAAAGPLPADEFVGDLPSGDGLVELFAEAEGRAAAAFGGAPDGESGPGRMSGRAGPADLWVNGADDSAADQSDWWTGDRADGPDGFTGEGTDDGLVTDLEV